MRSIKIVILRLYIDQDQTAQFCGDLQVLPARKTVPFKNETELLKRMHHLVNDKEPTLLLDELPDLNDPHSSDLSVGAE
jgi:hypothetical protein